MNQISMRPTCPHGNGPTAFGIILLKSGVPIYEHPITPFESLFLQYANWNSISITVAVRSAVEQGRIIAISYEMIACLDWISEKYRYGVI